MRVFVSLVMCVLLILLPWRCLVSYLSRCCCEYCMSCPPAAGVSCGVVSLQDGWLDVLSLRGLTQAALIPARPEPALLLLVCVCPLDNLLPASSADNSGGRVLLSSGCEVHRETIWLAFSPTLSPDNADSALPFKPALLTAGVAYIRVFIFYYHITYHILNMLKIKCDINQQDLKTVDLHFVKSE